MNSIEDHMSAINSSRSAQEAFDRFVAIVHGYGYDRLAYSCMTDCPSLRLKKGHGHISNFPPDWMEHYRQNNLANTDPVWAHALQSARPVYWSEPSQGEKVSAASKQLMRDAADAGLKGGIVIPLHGLSGEVSGVSVSRDAAEDESFETLAAISLVGFYFHEFYKSFIKKPELVRITPREYEILNWAAEGKTDFEIATITGQAPATVRYYWSYIFKKMSVHGRIHAVSKAIQLGLVTPGAIRARK